MPAADAVITYEDYLQSEQIIIRSKSLTDEQIACITAIQTVRPHPIIDLEDQTIATRRGEMDAKKFRQQARDWLAGRGLLASLPNYDPNTEKPLQYARRLESFCGIGPGAALEWNDHLGHVTFKTDWGTKPLKKGWLWEMLHAKRHNSQFKCLMMATAASNANEHGLRFGFVGNEAYTEEDPKP